MPAGMPIGVGAKVSSVVQCEQECQTDERVFTEQIDFIHRDAAQKGKECRKLQETIRLLRAELQQEKLVSEQFREQVEGLEKQLQDAMRKQHRAEGERSLVEWRLRNAEGAGGRMSRSCTPQPGSSRSLMKAWAEPGRTQDDGEPIAPSNDDPHRALGSSGSARSPCQGAREDDSESAEDSAAESEGSEDMEVFHPPPSRHGGRR